MKLAFFDTHPYDQEYFDKCNSDQSLEVHYFFHRLDERTAEHTRGYEAICCFVNDTLDEKVLEKISANGIKLIVLRCAGFNHVDLNAAKKFNIKITRVPEYSPYAVAEHTTALLLTLNRKIHRAYNRVREGNFSLDGLIGFDLHQKTVGLIGCGKIGKVFHDIMRGFGTNVIVYDLKQNYSDVTYKNLEDVLSTSDIISLHVPLNDKTFHIINRDNILKMKNGVILINTGRGALIDTKALIDSLKTGQIGGAGLDVYEEEAGIFFENLSGRILQDDTLARLLTFPNVLLTSHQAFLTKEALINISETTIKSLKAFAQNLPLEFEVKA